MLPGPLDEVNRFGCEVNFGFHSPPLLFYVIMSFRMILANYNFIRYLKNIEIYQKEDENASFGAVFTLMPIQNKMAKTLMTALDFLGLPKALGR
jgi:hypothetical protein